MVLIEEYADDLVSTSMACEIQICIHVYTYTYIDTYAYIYACFYTHTQL